LCSGLHDVIAHGVQHELGSRSQIELVHHRSAVGFYGLDADVEHVGDLLVDLALGDELDDLAFASSVRLTGMSPRERTSGY
jgi:hypothetical protein